LKESHEAIEKTTLPLKESPEAIDKPTLPLTPWRVKAEPSIEALLADCFPGSSILIEHREAVALYTAAQAAVKKA
jgi:hypothetical protein